MAFILTEEEIQLFRDFLRTYCGLVFADSQLEIFQKRIKKRMEANSFSSAKEYYSFLKFDPKRSDELKHLVDLVTVNETYFFREPMQMDMFRNDLLPVLKSAKEKAGSRRIRIWSAACSNGSEPYSLAILIRDSNLFDPALWKIEIFGTDINGEMIQTARNGIYTEPSLRTTSEPILKRYFQPDGTKQWKVNPDIQSMVKFSHLNLFNQAQMKLMRDIDLVFCRNALIYFDVEGKKEIVKMLYEALNPGGYLIISQTETLFKITTLFDIKPLSKVLLYRRPGPATA